MAEAVPAAAVGVVAGGVAVGVAEAAAALVSPESSPLFAVGAAVERVAPRAVTEFATGSLKSWDKPALLIGIGVLLAVFAAAIGIAARRDPARGYAGVCAFGVIGIAAVLTGPTPSVSVVIPTVLGVAAGCLTLRRLLPRLPSPAAAGEGWDRRRFIVTAGLTAVGAAVAGLGGRAVSQARFSARVSRAAVRLPAAASTVAPLATDVQTGVAGESPFVTPNGGFYLIHTELLTPQVAAETWKLRIHGMVRQEVTISYAELLAMPMVERPITLACVSNEIGGDLIGTATWLGVRLTDVLARAGIDPRADQLVCRASSGMTIGAPTRPVTDGRDALLAVGMNGEPLPIEHGFPVRMVVPGLYGYCSACKWLVDIEATTFGAYDAYWVKRGWAQVGVVRTESRIDTPREGAQVSAGVVPVAGVAWAQHRGISAVEVSVDGGPWQAARLAGEPSKDTWRLWTYPWDATPGDHTLAVRATDGTGTVQTDATADPYPSGATGHHTVDVSVG
jgi:DMSO/TMAO reductase YedYZ molybdopterin-dependent catalytic subunit